MKIKGIKTAILLFIDPDNKEKEARKVLFGEPDELSHLFLEQGPIIFKRIKQMQKMNLENITTDLKELAEDDGATVNKIEGGEQLTLDLSYKVSKKK